MTNRDIIVWIKKELSPYIIQAIDSRPAITHFTEDLLAGITFRETGGLIAKYAPAQKDPLLVCSIMRGDFSQRPGEKEKSFHGYGVTQIDIKSFPDFVRSGDWKNPLKCYQKTLEILEGKRQYLLHRVPDLPLDQLDHYVTAAYNCGEGNEAKVILAHLDPDAYTTGHNYAKEVLDIANTYKSLIWP